MVERDYCQLRKEAKEEWDSFWQDNQGLKDIDQIRKRAVSHAEYVGGENKDFYSRSFKARVSYQEKQRFISKIKGSKLEEVWKDGAKTQNVSLSRMAGQFLKLEREIRQKVKKEGITDVDIREDAVNRTEQMLAVGMLGLVNEKSRVRAEIIHEKVEVIKPILEQEEDQKDKSETKKQKIERWKSLGRKTWKAMGLMTIGSILLTGSVRTTEGKVGVVKQEDLDNKENQPKATEVFTKTAIVNESPTPEATKSDPTKSIASSAEIKIATPEAKPAKINSFKININGAEIDFSQSVNVKWPWGLKTDKDKYIDFRTDPLTVTTQNNDDLNKDERNIFLNTQKASIGRPSLVGVFETTFEQRLALDTHSGRLKIEPEKLGDFWETDWRTYYPDRDKSEKQIVNYPFQTLAEYGVKVVGLPLLTNNQVLIATEATIVTPEQWANACAPWEGEYNCEIRMVGLLNSWNRPGITLEACYGEYNKQTDSYPNRIVVSYETVPTRENLSEEAIQRPAVKEAIELADYTNRYSFRENKDQTIKEYIQGSSWYRKLSEEEKKLKDGALTIVESGSLKFKNILVEGIQCLGWEVLRTEGQVNIGGDGKDPGLMVPEEIKALSRSAFEEEVIIGGRKWTTGNIDYRDVSKGTAVMLWGTGAINQEGKDSGHTVITEDTWIDGNGITHTVFSEANPPKYPGMVILYEIDSQAEFDNTFGLNKAVLADATKTTISSQVNSSVKR